MHAIRTIGAVLGLATTLLAASPGAQAQDNYPVRPIHIIVPIPPAALSTSSPAP